MQANMGMAGEFRCVVKRADGSVKLDTGYQKNLILNQGLDFFGGGKGDSLAAYCLVGSGNTQPIQTQNRLDTPVGFARKLSSTSQTAYNSADGNLYKTNVTGRFDFSNLNNVNIAEIGLASQVTSLSNYYLCTRVLIKDSQGLPTTITVLPGELLSVYYKIWFVFDLTDKTGTINLLDGVGGSTALNYKTRPASVGISQYYSDFYLLTRVEILTAYNDSIHASAGDLKDIKTSGNWGVKCTSYTPSPYITGAYKRTIEALFDINTANQLIRTINVITTMGSYQIRFGSVADDSPINKTNTQTLTIPIEVSWGRYEGAL